MTILNSEVKMNLCEDCSKYQEGYKQALEDVEEILCVDCDTTLDRFYLYMDEFKELKQKGNEKTNL